MENIRYRADIDGLRAIAVLAVLLFHIDVNAFSGGYVGVDVFFVISGFLITRLIRDEIINTGQFSFINFYLRRARRLMPGFLFTLALSFIVAGIIFPPPQMEQFSGSLLYSIMGMANIYFWGQSGYFDIASVYKPLLHIWSLSVEEQFYLFWPLLLVFLLIKFPKRTVPWMLALVFSISLGLNFIFQDGQVSLLAKFFPLASEWFSEGSATIFYLMPFRVFEFAIGALLVWVIEHQPKNKLLLEPLMLAGLAMTLYPMLTYTATTLFPSHNALLPCFGTALLIYGGGESQYCGRLLRTPPLVEIGKISYSLYLIHWPAVIFYKYYIFKITALSAAGQILIAASAILAARLMYLYVEQPFRKSIAGKPQISTRRFLIVHLLSALILASLSASAWTHAGWAWRMPNSLTQKQLDEASDRRKILLSNSCTILDLKSPNCHFNAPLQVLVMGDSHYYVGYNMFFEAYGGFKDVNLISFEPVNQCQFSIKGKSLKANGLGLKNKGQCRERASILNDPGFNQILDVLVISSQNLFLYGEELPVVKHLKSRNPNLKIVLISPYINIRPYRCADIINRFGNSTFCKDARFINYFGDNFEDQPHYQDYQKFSDLLYINTFKMLCAQGRYKNCLTEVNGIPMFYDGDHISFEFSLLMGKRMMEEYSINLEKIGFPATGK